MKSWRAIRDWQVTVLTNAYTESVQKEIDLRTELLEQAEQHAALQRNQLARLRYLADEQSWNYWYCKGIHDARAVIKENMA